MKSLEDNNLILFRQELNNNKPRLGLWQEKNLADSARKSRIPTALHPYHGFPPPPPPPPPRGFPNFHIYTKGPILADEQSTTMKMY